MARRGARKKVPAPMTFAQVLLMMLFFLLTTMLIVSIYVQQPAQ